MWGGESGGSKEPCIRQRSRSTTERGKWGGAQCSVLGIRCHRPCKNSGTDQAAILDSLWGRSKESCANVQCPHWHHLANTVERSCAATEWVLATRPIPKLIIVRDVCIYDN